MAEPNVQLKVHSFSLCQNWFLEWYSVLRSVQMLSLSIA